MVRRVCIYDYLFGDWHKHFKGSEEALHKDNFLSLFDISYTYVNTDFLFS